VDVTHKIAILGETMRAVSFEDELFSLVAIHLHSLFHSFISDFCPQSWSFSNSLCYLISSSSSKSLNANNYCAYYNVNSTLFIPNNMHEFDVISSLLKSLEPCTECEFFIGCSGASLECLDKSNLKSLAKSKECSGAGSSNGKCATLKYKKSPFEVCIKYENCDTIKGGLSFICE
jgi:hypothetical protein